MKRNGFTLAEILITLTIIGIVASITIPALISDVYDRVWETKRAALYSRLTMAITAMPKLAGFGTNGDDAAESFIIDGLSKVYKIKTICGAENIEQCGLNHNFTNLSSQTKTFQKTLREQSGFSTLSPVSTAKAAYFETNNGEEVMVYYNRSCAYPSPSATSISLFGTMCANFLYDLNGSELPNQLGKDVGFITVFIGKNKETNVVAPNPEVKSLSNNSWANRIAECKKTRTIKCHPCLN